MRFTLLLTCLTISATFASPLSEHSTPEESLHLPIRRHSPEIKASLPVNSTLPSAYVNDTRVTSPSFHQAVSTFLYKHHGQPNVTTDLKHKLLESMSSFVFKNGHHRTNLDGNIHNMTFDYNTTLFAYHGNANITSLAAAMSELAHSILNSHG